MPADNFPQLFDAAHAWAAQAHAAGWLDEPALQRLRAVEQATPADLFTQPELRPLVAALFGGTGVGKSSLLNRLAGEHVATTGVQRPTSRALTVHVHESVELATLPERLRSDAESTAQSLLEPVHVVRHRNRRWQDVLWIDAPDIDSTADENRRRALAWLPHIDLLLYVASPERYRDDVGWRLLLQRGHRHGWIFVLNRWDEGAADQRADFLRQLAQAGFRQPVLFCTTCLTGNPPLPSADEFDMLVSTVLDLVEEHGAQELSRLGHTARLADLRAALLAATANLGDEPAWHQLQQFSTQLWPSATATLAEAAEWPLRTLAARFAAPLSPALSAFRESGMHRVPLLLGRLLGRPEPRDRVAAPSDQPPSSAGTDTEPGELGRLVAPLWDHWMQSRLLSTFDRLELACRDADIAARPLRERFSAIAGGARAIVQDSAQAELRAALARPGSRLRRWARRTTGFLTAALPLLCLAWVGLQLFVSYFHATTGHGTYLGSDFALHSALLVLVSWALPFILDRALRPSLERAAQTALRRGFMLGLDRLGAQLESALRELAADCATTRAAAADLAAQISAAATPPPATTDAPLGRLVASTARSGPVGA